MLRAKWWQRKRLQHIVEFHTKFLGYDKDANGNLLLDGDTVTVIKDFKVKGTSLVVKVGTRVKNIRLVGGDHDIDCKIEGLGPMKLKSQFVKKV